MSFLSVLAPSERYAARRGKRHKKITEWAWQMLLVLRRWYPEREIVAVADGAYAWMPLSTSRLLYAVLDREEDLASRVSACPTFR